MAAEGDHVSGTSYIPDPSGWRGVRFILDHNPCFLLSALLMFLGVYLLNAARDVSAAEMGKLLGVLAAVNVYEFALIGLAWLLVRKFGMEGRHRDPLLLLLIQMLFLADSGFLVNEAVQTNPHWGWVVNVVLLVLAIGKSALAMAAVKIDWRVRTLGFLGFQLAVLYGLPLALSHVAVAGEVSANAMYAAWWVVGLLPAFYDVIAGRQQLQGLTSRQQILRRSFVIVPWLFLVAHLGFFHYVYRADFFMADLSPVMLGLAVATRRIRATQLVPAKHLVFFRWALPIVAILIALTAPAGALALTAFGKTISNALFTAGVAMIAYGYFVSWSAAVYALLGIALAIVGHAIRPVTRIALHHGTDGGDRALRWLLGLLPTTTAGWGVAAIISAFMLLAIGGLASLRQTHRVE